MKNAFNPGDAAKIQKKDGGFYEAYVSEHNGKTWSRSPGTIVVGMNWDGDLIFVDRRPQDLIPMPIEDLTTSMRRDAMKLRQAHYLLQPTQLGDGK